MDANLAKVLALLIMALLILAGFLIYRRSASAKIKSPLGEIEFKGSNESSPDHRGAVAEGVKAGARIEDVRAGRDVKAQDKTGAGATISGADAGQDVIATSEGPLNTGDPRGHGETRDPKA